LSVGDVVPDPEIKNVFNYRTNTLKLSDFKGKLIILDFWSTNCSGCIKAFPKMDSLQNQFGKQIQILLVSRSGLDSTDRFFRLRKQIHKPNLPFITSDSIFHKYFPHDGEPFYALVDSQRRVYYFPDAISASMLQKYLNGEISKSDRRQRQVYLPSPIDTRIKDNIRFSSALLSSSAQFQITSLNFPNTDEITLNFASIGQLYMIAYDENTNYYYNGFIRPGKLILDVDNPSKYLVPSNKDLYDEWEKNHSYSYRLIQPKNLGTSKYTSMQQDLYRSFGINVSIEKREVKCLTLVRTPGKDRILSKGGRKSDTFLPTYILASKIDSVRAFTNQSYLSFSNRLCYLVEYYFGKAFIDSTGYDKNATISIQLNGKVMDSFDIELYKSELRKYNLDLIEKVYKMNVLVLRKNKN
jgi:thiol-disulfide isomerase/thioredoxin